MLRVSTVLLLLSPLSASAYSAVKDVPITSGELRTQVALERGAFRGGALLLGIRALGGRGSDQAERADSPVRRDPQDPAHLLEGELGVVVPLAVHGEQGRRAKPPQVNVEVALGGRDVRVGPRRGVEGGAADGGMC